MKNAQEETYFELRAEAENEVEDKLLQLRTDGVLFRSFVEELLASTLPTECFPQMPKIYQIYRAMVCLLLWVCQTLNIKKYPHLNLSQQLLK